MAVDAADLTRYWANKVNTLAFRAALWARLCDQSLNQAFQNQYQLTLQKNTGYGHAFAAHTVGSDWAASGVASPSQVNMSLDQIQESNAKIPWLRAELAPLSYRSLMAEQASALLGTTIDSNMAAYFLARAKALPSSQKISLGSNTNYIAYATGIAATTAAKALPLQVHDMFATHLYEQNLKPRGTTIGGMIGTYFLVWQPKAFRVFMESLRDSGAISNFEPMMDSILRRGSILGEAEFIGRMENIDHFVSTAISNPSAQNGKWDIVGGCSSWMLYASKPPLMSKIEASSNQTAPEYDDHILAAWSRAEYNIPHGFYATIEAGTS